MKIKKFLATAMAVAMAITIMPNLSMVAHAFGGGCTTCGHREDEHMEGGSCHAPTEEGTCTCESYQAPHICTYETDWSYDSSHHFKKSTCHPVVTDMALHNNDGTNGGCSVCGWTAHTHTPVGGWKVTDCGTYHYKACSGCSDMLENAEHTFGSDGKCTVCGYSKAGSSSSSSAPAAPTAEQMHEEYAKAVEATVAKEEALPVTSFASEAAVKAIPAEVKADNVATLNISAVTTTQGFVATINKVAKATTAPSMAVYSAKPITMNATALNAVAKTGKTLVYTFTYKGHIYKVTIPAGAKVNTNGQMFMGPLAIGAQLGTTQVIK